MKSIKTPDTTQSSSLDTFSPGQSGIIYSIGNIDRAVRRRLIDMGLTPGTEVTVKKAAPFGDPIEVSVRGYSLSLRKSDAAKISMGSRGASSKGRSVIYYTSKRLNDDAIRRMRADHEHELDNHVGNYDPTAHDRRDMKIALAGNPNSGKTTLFNALTGSEQTVGNWPGVTVDKKEGKTRISGRDVIIVDLPGIYSLSPYSMEELITRDYIIEESPDAIINIVDATNLERNLYLTVQLLELERPMVIALNFMDEFEKNGDKIDTKRLSEKLGIPVVPITARTGKNLDELLHCVHRQVHMGFTLEPDDLYDDLTHSVHHQVSELIHDYAYAVGLPAHWASVKLIEGDQIVERSLGLPSEISLAVGAIANEYESSSSLGDRETLVADSRYGYIEKVIREALSKGDHTGKSSLSDRIDKIVTNKYLALPVFFAAMLIVFSITFGPPGTFLSDGIGSFIDGYIAVWAERGMHALGVAPWLVSLCVNGIIAGVGGVLTFLPQIALLFMFLSILEDSGYMARAAFIMDRLLKRFGLSGKAFIPMLMGFGCTVPAVMGARTMENEKDRKMAIMLMPFMSCSAKLPVYGLISSAFFRNWAGLAVFSLYVLGMVMAVATGLILKSTALRGEPAPFVLELPPYRMPTLKNTARRIWEKTRGFIVRAGTLILVMSVILWALQTFDLSLSPALSSKDSILGKLGGLLVPVFRPLGFGDWQSSVALLTGFIAKEAVVASLSMFYGFSVTAAPAAVAEALGSTFQTPLAALSFLVFILLYVPCVAAISTIYREMNSLRWTAASVGWQIGAAYIVSFIVFQAGSLLGL